ncbi:MAG: YihY/virulence factor BrkB family protein [Eubacterium sp.]|nr:YihY/virulence factor BrkB family protein [Eubacterium sp.]
MNRIKDIIRFWEGTADEHMAAFAAQSAFFIFLSFFPIMNIIIGLPKALNITEEQVIEIICYMIPSRFEDLVVGVVDEMYGNFTSSFTVISILLALWSAAKGITAIRYGLNEVYRSRESRNYFIVRGIGSLYTLVFILIFIAIIPLNMFGTQIAGIIIRKFPIYYNEALLVYSLRNAATFVLLLIVFDLMYTIVPTRKLSFIKQIPGAVLAAFSWVVITKVFSLYIDYVATRNYMYGSLTTVVMLLFWMYIVIYLVFIGAQLNEYLYTCRKREQEYELSKYKDDQTEVWDDDEMEDSEHLGEYTREEMDAILDEKPEPPSFDEDDDFEDDIF